MRSPTPTLATPIDREAEARPCRPAGGDISEDRLELYGKSAAMLRGAVLNLRRTGGGDAG